VRETVIKLIAGGATDSAAAAAVGTTRKSLQRHRSDASFARVFDLAKVVGKRVRAGKPVPRAAIEDLSVEFEARGWLTDDLPEPEVIIPEVLPAPGEPVDHVWPPLGRVADAAASAGLDDHPTVRKANEIVDNKDEPVALRVAAWRTIHEATLGPAIEQVMLSLKVHAMERAQAASAETAPATADQTAGRGVGREATADLMDAIAGPAPAE
jgi:hypothetical protein